MKRTIDLLLLCSAFGFAVAGVANAQFEYYAWPDPEESVVVDTAEDLWPVSNLIQGPGVGFDAEAPNEQPGGGADTRWVTNADAGFPSDYVEDVQAPVLQFDLGADVPLKEISVWGYSGGNSNGTSQFSLRFATEAEGGTDGLIDADIEYGQSITFNPTYELFSDPAPQQIKLFSEHVTARYVEFTNLDNFFILPGDGSEPPEPPLERLLPILPGGDRVGLGEVAFMKLPDSFQPGDLIPQKIEGDDFGTFEVAAARSGQEFGPASDPQPGLLQEWFLGGPTNKSGVDAIFDNNDPVVPPFRSEVTSWFSGRYEADTSGEIPAFPEQVASVVLDGGEIPFVEASPHAVRLTGEILLEESGVYRFTDAVDDFTYLAIDADRSGVAGDSDGEVLIEDSNWTDIFTAENGGSPIAELDIEVAEGGEWLGLEFNAGDNGANGPGVLYWDYSTEDGIGEGEFFPIDSSESLEDAFTVQDLLVPDSHLRSSTTELLKSDSTSSLADSFQADILELQLQVGPNGNDQIAVEEGKTVGEGVATLDVSDTTIRIIPSGEIADGTEFQIFAADEVTGLESLNLIAEGFDTSRLSEGVLVFGAAGCNINTGGDIDGDGTVGFSDFLLLSDNFGTEVSGAGHEQGDVDCDGTVGFSDFLVLSSNFGTTVGAEASSVPEPTGFALLGLAGMFAGLLRRRR